VQHLTTLALMNRDKQLLLPAADRCLESH